MNTRPLILALCVATFLQACTGAPENADAQTARTALVGRVLDSAEGTSVAVGQVRSSRLAVVSSEQGGRIVELLVDVGDRVSAGQPLARLDPAPTRFREQQAAAELQRSEAVASERQRNAARVAGLHADGVATDADLEAAQADARAAEAARDAATAATALAGRDAGEAVLRAPISGVVAARPVQLSVVAPGVPAFEIEGNGQRRIHAVLPTTLVDSLEPGARVTFAHGGTMGSARLTGISARDNGAGGREAVFAVTTGSPAPGTTVELRLSRRQVERTLIVPLSAVLTDRTGRQSVRMVDSENKLRDIPVTLVATHGNSAEVSGQLSPGQFVVVAGAEFLQAATTVRPRLAQR